MWISPLPGAYSKWNFCFLPILADFTSANGDFLRKSARSCSLTHTHTWMYSIIQLLLLGENMPRLLGATFSKCWKRAENCCTLMGSSSRHRKWMIDLSYFDKTKHLFMHLPPLLVVVYFFQASILFSIKNAKFWPILTYFGLLGLFFSKLMHFLV